MDSGGRCSGRRSGRSRLGGDRRQRILARRLDAAGLPVAPVVALVPPEHRFVIGAGYLVGPLFAALIGFLADYAIWPICEPFADTGPRRRVAPVIRLVFAAMMAAFGAVLGQLMLKPPNDALYWLQAASVVAVVTLVLAHDLIRASATGQRRATHSRPSSGAWPARNDPRTPRTSVPDVSPTRSSCSSWCW